MRILITGAAGFIGTRLSETLLSRDVLFDASGSARRIQKLVLADRTETAFASDPRVRAVAADVSDPQSVRALLQDGFDSVFALAASLTVEAENDFARGLDINLRGMLSLLEACREGARPPRLVFASSIAAFGGPLPEAVDDTVQLTPQTSYGTHKAIGELLVNDYTRHGFVDGRSLRLPVVLVRPGAPSSSSAPATTVSGAIAAIVRDRLAGIDVVCPLAPETRIAAASIGSVVDALVAIHELPADAFGHTRSMNLPSLSLTLRGLAEATERIGQGHGHPVGAIEWAPDPRFQSAVEQWPRRFVSGRASGLGIRSDANADEIVERYLREQTADMERSAQ